MSISVVIPAYNSEAYLRAALESVFAQTLLPDEVVVVDDGSTDSTVAIAESFAPRVRVLRQRHQRANAARNLGVKETSGEWIALLDSDDIWLPTKLERQMEELRKTPDADLCYTARQFLVQDGLTATLGFIPYVPPASAIREALLRTVTFIPSSVVIRRSTFNAVGGFKAEQRYAQDWELWMRLLHSGATFAAVQEPLVLHRRHSTSMSSNILEQYACSREVFHQSVLPYLPAWKRWLRLNQFDSKWLGEAAYMLRQRGDARCLGLMARSILLSPTLDARRYKVFAHMVYTRLTGGTTGRRV